MIDWNGALEAVHTDGRVLAIDRRDTSKRNETTWLVLLEGRPEIVWDADGRTMYATGWSIRNVQPVSSESDRVEARRICDASPYQLEDAPVVTNGHIYEAVLSGILRGRELAASDEPTRRALALVERMAAAFHESHLAPLGKMAPDSLAYIKVSEFIEARAIQALRNPPTDPRVTMVAERFVADGMTEQYADRLARMAVTALASGE